MVICLERGADLHTAQLMPLPLTVSCFSEIQIGFTFQVPFWYRLTRVVPEKGPLNVCVCVCFALEMASPWNQQCASSVVPYRHISMNQWLKW